MPKVDRVQTGILKLGHYLGAWIVSKCWKQILTNIRIELLEHEFILIFKCTDWAFIEILENLIRYFSIYWLLKNTVNCIFLSIGFIFNCFVCYRRNWHVHRVDGILCVKAFRYSLLNGWNNWLLIKWLLFLIQPLHHWFRILIWKNSCWLLLTLQFSWVISTSLFFDSIMKSRCLVSWIQWSSKRI